MSILIRGMEMPTSCGFCMFEQETGDGCECYINGCLTEYQKRPDDCPLVYVPKHGRLIDADALMELYADTDDLQLANMNVPIAVIRQNILDAPTIIPAEPPKEET
jgi:hypothetical protein